MARWNKHKPRHAPPPGVGKWVGMVSISVGLALAATGRYLVYWPMFFPCFIMGAIGGWACKEEFREHALNWEISVWGKPSRSTITPETQEDDRWYLGVSRHRALAKVLGHLLSAMVAAAALALNPFSPGWSIGLGVVCLLLSRPVGAGMALLAAFAAYWTNWRQHTGDWLEGSLEMVVISGFFLVVFVDFMRKNKIEGSTAATESAKRFLGF